MRHVWWSAKGHETCVMERKKRVLLFITFIALCVGFAECMSLVYVWWSRKNCITDCFHLLFCREFVTMMLDTTMYCIGNSSSTFEQLPKYWLEYVCDNVANIPRPLYFVHVIDVLLEYAGNRMYVINLCVMERKQLYHWLWYIAMYTPITD